MGGNAFEKAEPIKLDDLPGVISSLEQLLNVSLADSFIGSTGLKPIMGDVDLISPFPLSELSSKLSKYELSCNDNKRILKVLFPYKSKFVQVDFLYGNHDWLKWAMQSGDPSGSHRGNLLQAITQHSGRLYRHNRKIVGRIGYSYDRAWGLRRVYQQCNGGKRKTYIGELKTVSQEQFKFPIIDLPPTIISVDKAKSILRITDSRYKMLVNNVRMRNNAHEIFATYKNIMKRNKIHDHLFHI